MADSPSRPATPRWVKAAGIIAIAFVVLFLVMHLTGSGMGPGMHSTGGH